MATVSNTANAAFNNQSSVPLKPYTEWNTVPEANGGVAVNMNYVIATGKIPSGQEQYYIDWKSHDAFTTALQDIQNRATQRIAQRPDLQAILNTPADQRTKTQKENLEKGVVDIVSEETEKVPGFGHYRTTANPGATPTADASHNAKNIQRLNDLSSDITNNTEKLRYDCGVESAVKGVITQKINNADPRMQMGNFFYAIGGQTWGNMENQAGGHAFLFTPAGNVVEETADHNNRVEPYKKAVGISSLKSFVDGAPIVTEDGAIYGQKFDPKQEVAAQVIRIRARDENAIKTIQSELSERGLYKGEVTGKWNPETNRAFETFTDMVQARQKSQGLPVGAPGQMDQQTISYLQSPDMRGLRSMSMANAVATLNNDGILPQAYRASGDPAIQADALQRSQSMGWAQPTRPAPTPTPTPVTPAPVTPTPVTPTPARPTPAPRNQEIISPTASPGPRYIQPEPFALNHPRQAVIPPPQYNPGPPGSADFTGINAYRRNVMLFDDQGRHGVASIGGNDLSGIVSVGRDPRMPDKIRISVADPDGRNPRAFTMSPIDARITLAAYGPQSVPLLRQIAHYEAQMYGERVAMYRNSNQPYNDPYQRYGGQNPYAVNPYGRDPMQRDPSQYAGRGMYSRDDAMSLRVGIALRHEFGGEAGGYGRYARFMAQESELAQNGRLNIGGGGVSINAHINLFRR